MKMIEEYETPLLIRLLLRGLKGQWSVLVDGVGAPCRSVYVKEFKGKHYIANERFFTLSGSHITQRKKIKFLKQKIAADKKRLVAGEKFDSETVWENHLVDMHLRFD